MQFSSQIKQRSTFTPTRIVTGCFLTSHLTRLRQLVPRGCADSFVITSAASDQSWKSLDRLDPFGSPTISPHNSSPGLNWVPRVKIVLGGCASILTFPTREMVGESIKPGRNEPIPKNRPISGKFATP